MGLNSRTGRLLDDRLGLVIFTLELRLLIMTFTSSVLRDSIQCVVQDDDRQIAPHHHHSQTDRHSLSTLQKSGVYVVL